MFQHDYVLDSLPVRGYYYKCLMADVQADSVYAEIIGESTSRFNVDGQMHSVAE